MNTPFIQAYPSGRMQGLFRALFCLAVTIATVMLSACSDSEDAVPATEPNIHTVSSSSSRMPTGGVLESQYADSPSGSGLAQLVDGNNNTKFITYHSNFYILWSAYESAVVNYYALTSADDEPECDPRSWSLYGSNDKENWTLLDSQTDQVFTERKEKKEFEISNTRAYQFIRLDITANSGGGATQIAQYSLQSIKLDISDLMAYAGGDTYSSVTPMGSHYENAVRNLQQNPLSQADMDWLADAAKEPPVPATNAADFSWKEFGVLLYPTSGNPNPSDANQHGIGDCSAIAVFASFAYIYPDFIKSLITDNGDNTYTVAMFDPLGDPVYVTVSSKFLADGNGDIQSVSGKNNVACWTSVLEKAIIKWNTVYKVNTDINGIGTEHAIPLFTGDGNSFSFDRGVLNNEQLARAVEVSLKQGKFVVGGFSPSKIISGTAVSTVTAHAYTAMHTGNSSMLFAMRNPWGFNYNADDSEDGVINIPNDSEIPPTIDLRIVEPGIASRYGSGVTEPYVPPVFAPGTAGGRITPALSRGLQ